MIQSLLIIFGITNIAFSITALVYLSKNNFDSWEKYMKLWVASEIIWCILFAMNP